MSLNYKRQNLYIENTSIKGIAKINSTNSPDEYETITRGKTTHDPFMIISRKVASSPSTL